MNKTFTINGTQYTFFQVFQSGHLLNLLTYGQKQQLFGELARFRRKAFKRKRYP